MTRRGVLITLTILSVGFALTVAFFVAIYLAIGREPPVPSNAILTLKLGGDLAEVAPTDVVSYVRGGRTPTVRGVIDNLRKAKVDRRITGVLIEPTGFDMPFWGKLDELRDAVLDFKGSGKPLYAYLEYGTDRDYYLASAADKVFLMPSSALDLTGVATYELFLRGTLDKVGVYPDLHHIGDYKTYSNTFTEKAFTKAHREMDESLNRDMYDRLVSAIAQGRKKTAAQVQQLIDEGPFLPEQALKGGLVDEVAYEDQARDALKAVGAAEGSREIDGESYSGVSTRSVGLDRGPRVAVIYISGEIASGKSGYDPVNGAVLGSDTLIDYIHQARRDSSIRAVVLRIDSPGGSASASDVIWHELMLARKEHADRPMVASMGDLAASGGYYVALPADVIVAQPSTLTGSIGVVGGKFVTGGAYEKLGATIDATSDGRHAQMNSFARPYSGDDLKKVQEQLDAFYDQFVERVAQGRHSTPQQIDRIAQGRVWTGHQGKENGLVDELGGLQRAIAIAKDRAKIPPATDVELVVFPPRKSFYEILAEELSGSGEQAAISRWVSTNFSNGELEALRALRGPSAIFRRGEPLALMPFTFLR